MGLCLQCETRPRRSSHFPRPQEHSRLGAWMTVAARTKPQPTVLPTDAVAPQAPRTFRGVHLSAVVRRRRRHQVQHPHRVRRQSRCRTPGMAAPGFDYGCRCDFHWHPPHGAYSWADEVDGTTPRGGAHQPPFARTASGGVARAMLPRCAGDLTGSETRGRVRVDTPDDAIGLNQVVLQRRRTGRH